MGTSYTEGSAASADAAPIHRFYSSNTWIEGAAEEQLSLVSEMAGVSHVAAFPDLHPGKYGPVGSAILADRIYPQLIGNDIGCGMSLYALDLTARKLRLDKAAQKLRALEGVWTGDAATRLSQAGLARDLHTQALGTIGGGNHFCELQVVDDINLSGLQTSPIVQKGDLMLLVHSGSRSLGMAVFGSVLDGLSGLDPDKPEGRSYLAAHADAVRWASLNRQLIAERAADALRTDLRLIWRCSPQPDRRSPEFAPAQEGRRESRRTSGSARRKPGRLELPAVSPDGEAGCPRLAGTRLGPQIRSPVHDRTRRSDTIRSRKPCSHIIRWTGDL